MDNEQGARLNKLLRIVGYIISGVVIWFYGTKGIVFFLLPPEKIAQDIVGAYASLGFLWPIVAVLIVNGSYHLYTWIRTGKSESIFDLLEAKDE